jgi:hypothetical protein
MSELPATIDARISTAETEETASDNATAAMINVRKASIVCPVIRPITLGQVNFP